MNAQISQLWASLNACAPFTGHPPARLGLGLPRRRRLVAGDEVQQMSVAPRVNRPGIAAADLDAATGPHHVPQVRRRLRDDSIPPPGFCLPAWWCRARRSGGATPGWLFTWLRCSALRPSETASSSRPQSPGQPAQMRQVPRRPLRVAAARVDRDRQLHRSYGVIPTAGGQRRTITLARGRWGCSI
jgi:hypothetical protein